jgi:hypothetical protein
MHLASNSITADVFHAATQRHINRVSVKGGSAVVGGMMVNLN